MVIRGVAIGAISTFRLLGGAIATAIYSAIVDNRFTSLLPTQVKYALATLHSDFSTEDLRALVEAASTNTAAAYAKLEAEVPGITPQIIKGSQWAVKLAYTQAFKVVYYTALGFAVLAVLSALCVRDVDVEKKNLDKAVFLENEKVKKGYEKHEV